mmetsp:Transcript_2549/g.5879  ORF Transcript_2549/g.5879 Transcript_2549/m.5879 type:complete len:218 (-) Transcript_2549:810-1463(-)
MRKGSACDARSQLYDFRNERGGLSVQKCSEGPLDLGPLDVLHDSEVPVLSSEAVTCGQKRYDVVQLEAPMRNFPLPGELVSSGRVIRDGAQVGPGCSADNACCSSQLIDGGRGEKPRLLQRLHGRRALASPAQLIKPPLGKVRHIQKARYKEELGIIAWSRRHRHRLPIHAVACWRAASILLGYISAARVLVHLQQCSDLPLAVHGVASAPPQLSSL